MSIDRTSFERSFYDNKLFIGGLQKLEIAFGQSIWAVSFDIAIPW
jgi:hypothetical protein